MIEIGINPVAFSIGSFEVRWYGIMIALGVLVMVLWMVRQVKKGARLSYDQLFTAALIAIPSGMIMSKLIHVIDKYDLYSQYPSMIWSFEGLTIWGAILGATLGIWVYSRFSRFPFGHFMDLVVFPTLLAQMLGRVGCFINGCCYGAEAPSWLPWSVVYTHSECYSPLGVALHPTQIYEIAFLLITFGVLFMLRKRFQPEGSLFLIYLSAYSAWRVGMDFIRDGTSFLFGLHQAQVIGIIVLLIVIPILIWRTRWVKTPRLKD